MKKKREPNLLSEEEMRQDREQMEAELDHALREKDLAIQYLQEDLKQQSVRTRSGLLTLLVGPKWAARFLMKRRRWQAWWEPLSMSWTEFLQVLLGLALVPVLLIFAFLRWIFLFPKRLICRYRGHQWMVPDSAPWHRDCRFCHKHIYVGSSGDQR